MSPLRLLYPLVLSGINVGVGWLLYRPLESAAGLVLLAAGLLVLLAVAVRVVGRVTVSTG